MTATITTADLATQFETTPRTLRKFLRSDDSKIESVGKGKRYALPGNKRDLTAMQKRFNAWSASQAEIKSEGVSLKKAPKVVEEVEDIDALAADLDAEPTDDELDAIDADEL